MKNYYSKTKSTQKTRSTFSTCSCSPSLCAAGRLGVTLLGNGFSLFQQSLVITSSFLSGMGLRVQVPFSILGFVSFFFPPCFVARGPCWSHAGSVAEGDLECLIFLL